MVVVVVVCGGWVDRSDLSGLWWSEVVVVMVEMAVVAMAIEVVMVKVKASWQSRRMFTYVDTMIQKQQQRGNTDY